MSAVSLGGLVADMSRVRYLLVPMNGLAFRSMATEHMVDHPKIFARTSRTIVRYAFTANQQHCLRSCGVIAGTIFQRIGNLT